MSEKLLKLSEISLWLDTYDDIFSDFDPRPYNERALSVDFLEEAKRASMDKITGIDLKLLIKKRLRNETNERLIKKKLKNHFKRHHQLLVKDKSKVVRRGSFFIIFGIIMMVAASIVLFENKSTLFDKFLIVLLEPASWFLFWEGMNQIVFESNKVNPDLEFYRKMTNCKIEFVSY